MCLVLCGPCRPLLASVHDWFLQVQTFSCLVLGSRGCLRDGSSRARAGSRGCCLVCGWVLGMGGYGCCWVPGLVMLPLGPQLSRSRVLLGPHWVHGQCAYSQVPWQLEPVEDHKQAGLELSPRLRGGGGPAFRSAAWPHHSQRAASQGGPASRAALLGPGLHRGFTTSYLGPQTPRGTVSVDGCQSLFLQKDKGWAPYCTI